MMAIRSLSPTKFLGQPWSNWTDFLGQMSPKEDTEESSCRYKAPATGAMKLPKRDMDLYGFCPERDQFTVVVCETCCAVVKPQCLKNHIEVRHSAESVKPAPTSPVSKKTPTKSFKSMLKNGKSKVCVKKAASLIIAKADSTKTFRHVAESVKPTPSKSFKSMLKNGKSKVRVKKPASVIIAKADSTETFRLATEGVLPNPTNSFKSMLKNGKSKVPMKEPVSVIIAKADSTTKPVIATSNDSNNNSLAVASSSNVTDTAVEMAVVCSTTNTAKPGVVTNLLTKGITNNLVPNGIVGMAPSALIITPPNSDAMEDSESPVGISVPVMTHMESDDKMSSDGLKNGELQPVVALSPLVNNKPNSPAAPIAVKSSVAAPPHAASLPPSPPAIAVNSPQNNIPPALIVSPAAVPSTGLPNNPAKPRRIIRAERKSLSSKEKEYNADKHCGVVVGESKPCTRSLTCRLHSMPMRRAVEGRSKTFDQLLAEHRATKEAVIRQKKSYDSNYNQNTSTVAVLNLQVDGVVNTVSGNNTVSRVNVTPITNSVSSGGGGCGPPEMGIRLPVSLLSPSTVNSQVTPTLGSCTSELMTATPLDTTSNSPLSSVNVAVNGKPFLSPRSTHINLSYNKIIEPTEAATPSISTAVDITVTRAHPKPLALGLFNAHKIGGLIYSSRKFRMARHFVNDLEDLY